MKKRLFVVTKHPYGVDISYKPSLRNFLLHLQLKHAGGVPDELPIGEWYASFNWQHSRLIPGILFREL